MRFYKPVTYSSILEQQAMFLLGPIACHRFIKFIYESDTPLTMVSNAWECCSEARPDHHKLEENRTGE